MVTDVRWIRGSRVLWALLLALVFQVATGASGEVRPQRDLEAVVASVSGQGITMGEVGEMFSVLYTFDEQKLFEIVIVERVLPHAARIEGVTWQEAEIMAMLPERMRDLESYRQSFEPIMALARASLKVANGDEPDTVFERDLKPLGLSRQQFEEHLRMFGDDPDKIQHFLDIDHGKRIRDREIRMTRTKLLRSRLREALASKVTTSVSFESLASALWSQALEGAAVRILDPAYHMPEWQAAFDDAIGTRSERP
jgi:hypothetical protein